MRVEADEDTKKGQGLKLSWIHVTTHRICDPNAQEFETPLGSKGLQSDRLLPGLVVYSSSEPR